MRSLKKLTDIKGKKVLVRVDFNVPLKDGDVEDDFRIQKALPTIRFLEEQGAKLILISHLGKGEESLAKVSECLNKYITTTFVSQVVGEEVVKKVAEMQDGEIILLENLRREKGEQSGDMEFAKKLAELAEIYVNDAFPVSHREDSSIVLVPTLLPSYAGFQLEEEVRNLSTAIENPERPFLFILGGSKFSTKMPLIKKYLDLADYVFVGGALLNDFLKAKGYEVGQSLVDGTSSGIEEILNNPKLLLPEDVIVLSDDKLVGKKVTEVLAGDSILDLGGGAVAMLEPYVKNAKLILWNGPLGKYESGGGEGTKQILKLVADSQAKSIIGGGDTVALISEMGMEKDFTFVSTGGGATLDFLVNGTLPGIKALQ
ncbi:MAG: phosphoglycerate kinase [Candidatus Pacebacteria bacterium]|nr:phosphoglycerate kinase [Candidatus Paceibacterota bacterium]